MDYKKIAHSFEAIKEAQTSYIKRVLVLLDVYKNGANSMRGSIAYFRNIYNLEAFFFQEELDKLSIIEQYIPAQIKEIEELETFLGQYEENFSLTSSFRIRVRLVSEKVKSAGDLISEFFETLSGKVKSH
jgi:hypothetical protein